MSIETSPCCKCKTHAAEVMVFPTVLKANQPKALCANCAGQGHYTYSIIFPVNFVRKTEEDSLETEGKLFLKKTKELINWLQNYKERVELQKKLAKTEYEALFTDLQNKLEHKKINILELIEKEVSQELIKINTLLSDLQTVSTARCLSTELVYLASEYISPLSVAHAFLSTDRHLDSCRSLVSNVPEPVIESKFSSIWAERPFMSPRDMEGQPGLLEGNTIVYPVDQNNLVKYQLQTLRSELMSLRNFPFRQFARWCKVDPDRYIYTGGFVNGNPTVYCSFFLLDTEFRRKPALETGASMKVERYKHAMICHRDTVYVFGGVMKLPNTLMKLRKIEMMQKNDSWTNSKWRIAEEEMPLEIPDLTATVVLNTIYLSGKSAAVLAFDTLTMKCAKLMIQEDHRKTPQFLPMSASNSLICTWGSELIVIQERTAYWLVPGSNQQEKAGCCTEFRPWCSPFPALVCGRMVYFMQESPEEDGESVSGQIYCFDFLKKTLNLVDFNQG